MKAVIFSPEALADLDGIAEYISSDNFPRAMSFVEELRKAAINIAHAPKAYPPRPDVGPGIRAAIRRPYLIFFREARSGIDVLRIVHGARDIPKLFQR